MKLFPSSRSDSRRDIMPRCWHHGAVRWNKDNITDFAEELDKHRDAKARGESSRLSDDCHRFLNAYMLHRLPDDQLDFFERRVGSIAVRHLVRIYNDSSDAV